MKMYAVAPIRVRTLEMISRFSLCLILSSHLLRKKISTPHAIEKEA